MDKGPHYKDSYIYWKINMEPYRKNSRSYSRETLNMLASSAMMKLHSGYQAVDITVVVTLVSILIKRTWMYVTGKPLLKKECIGVPIVESPIQDSISRMANDNDNDYNNDDNPDHC